jgi:hypothetical protein
MAPIVGRTGYRGGRDGAIAQLGERVVRNDEVGGSIPPGSTTLRPLGFAWRGHVMTEERSVPGEAHLGEDGLSPKILLFVVHKTMGIASLNPSYGSTSPAPIPRLPT